MADREKVIKGIAFCKRSWVCNKECPYYCEQDAGNACGVFDDAIALLKEQENREPIKLPAHITMPKEAWNWGCPNCKYQIGYKWQYCPRCGQRMDWSNFGS